MPFLKIMWVLAAIAGCFIVCDKLKQDDDDRDLGIASTFLITLLLISWGLSLK